MNIVKGIQRCVALLLIPCLLADPGLVLAASLQGSPPPAIALQSAAPPPAAYAEQALASHLALSQHAIGQFTFWMRQSVGQYLGVGAHAQGDFQTAPLASTDVGSVVAQEWARKSTLKSWEGRFAIIKWLLFSPAILTHEILGHILPGYVPMGYRGDLRLNSFWEILKGVPFRLPATQIGSVWTPWYVRWGGVFVNLLFSLPILIHWFTGFTGHSAFLASYPGADAWLHGWFSIYWAAVNLIFVIREVTQEFDLKRGEIYSSFNFKFDRTFPFLLSERQGQHQMEKAVDLYLANPDSETVPYLGLIRIDWPFRNIADRRMGSELSNVLRRRIFSFITDKIRRDFPGTTIAATAHPNEILIISSTQLGRPAPFMDEIETTIGTLISQYLTDSYILVETPEIASLGHNLPARQWKRVKAIFASRGIYFSDYAGGSALVIKPYDIKSRRLVDLPTAQIEVDEAIKKANTYLLHQNLATPGRSIGSMNLAEADVKNPSYPITLSAVAAGIRKSDELTAWRAIAPRLSVLSERESRRMAQDWLNDRANISEYQRKNQCLLNLKQVLISLEREVATRLGAMIVQRAMQVDSPDPTKPLVKSPGTMHIRQGILDIYGRRIDRDPSEKDELTVPLLDTNEVENVRPNAVVEAEDNAAQKATRLKANIMLEDYPQRLQLAVQRMQRDRREAGEHFRDVLESAKNGTKARITQVIVGGKTPEQADMFGKNYERGLIPTGTDRSVIHNPQAPAGMKTYLFEGKPSDGNGLALLGTMREFMRTLLMRKSVELRANFETRNLYKAMNGEVVMWELNAGLSTRNKIATQGGKINLPMPVVSQVPSPEGRDRAEIVEEELHILAHMMADVFPTWIKGLQRFAFLLIYGDNVPTARASTLRDALAKNPEISEGFTLLFAPAPAKQAHLWGTGDIDFENSILRLLVEKPAIGVLSPDELVILKGIASGVKDPKRDPDAMAVLEKLKVKLGELHLLKEDQLAKNTGVGWIGGGTVIRLMQMAGVRIDLNGDFQVERNGEVPLQEWDKEGLLTDFQDTLAALLTSEDKAETVSVLEAMRDGLEGGSAAEYSATDPKAKVFVTGVISDLLTANSRLLRPAMRVRMRSAIQIVGKNRTLIEGVLRDGVALDAIADFGSKMAQEADPEVCLFGKVVAFLEKRVAKPNQDIANRDLLTRMSDIKDHAGFKDLNGSRGLLAGLYEIMRMPLRQTEDVQKVSSALEVDMALIRVRLAGKGLNPQERFLVEVIYHAYATARWHAEMWYMIHREGGRAGSGKAFGVSSEESGWLDAGSNHDWHRNSLRENADGAEVSAVFNYHATVNTAGSVHHGANAYIDPEHSDVDPYTLLMDALFLPYDATRGKFSMKRGSALLGVGFPWGGFTMPERAQVTEGVVKKATMENSFVIYPMWDRQDTDPDGSDKLFGSHLSQWLPLQLTEGQMRSIWPDPTKVITMFQLPVWPGVSLPLIKAWYEGKRGAELRAAAIDDLDWEIFEAYPQIFNWLIKPGDVKSPPLAWLHALEQGRVFASGDRAFNSDVIGFGELKDARTALIDKWVAQATSGAILDLRPVRNGPWLTSGGTKETERRISVEQSQTWAGRFGRAAQVLGIAAAVLIGVWSGGAQIPGYLPVVFAGMGIYAYEGGRFLAHQADVLGHAKELARTLRSPDGGAERIERSPAIAEFMAGLEARYAAANNGLQWVTNGEIQHLPEGNFTQVDALVAYLIHQADPAVLDNILMMHEPSHRIFKGEGWPSILQAWTHPLSAWSPVSSRAVFALMAPFAPVALLLTIAGRIVSFIRRSNLQGLDLLAVQPLMAMAA